MTYTVNVSQNTITVTSSVIGQQGDPGNNISNTYIDASGYLHIVTSSAAGVQLADSNVGAVTSAAAIVNSDVSRIAGAFASGNYIVNGSGEYGTDYWVPTSGATAPTLITGLSNASFSQTTAIQGTMTGTPSDTVGTLSLQMPVPLQGDFSERTYKVSYWLRTSNASLPTQFILVAKRVDGTNYFRQAYYANSSVDWTYYTSNITTASGVNEIRSIDFRVYATEGFTDSIDVTAVRLEDV